MKRRPWILAGWNHEPTMQRLFALHVERSFVAFAVGPFLIGVRRP